MYCFDKLCVWHWLILIPKRGSFDPNLKRGTFNNSKYLRNCEVTIDTERHLITIFENPPGIYFEPIRNLKFTETKYHLVSFIKVEDTILIYTSISQMYKSAVLNCKNKNTHFCLGMKTMIDLKVKKSWWPNLYKKSNFTCSI